MSPLRPRTAVAGSGVRWLKRIGKGLAGAWFLEVRESNRAAINLYLSMGFEIVGTRPEYYRDPAEAAIVMRFFS